MAVIVLHSYFHHAILSLPSSSSFRPSSSLLLSRNRRISCCSASSFMNPQNTSSSNRLLEFPYVSAPHRDLMVELLSSVETRLASSLRPCTLPPDVQYYQNQSATAQAALHVRSGIQSSQFTFDVAVLSIFGELDTKYKDRLKNNYYLLDKGYNSFPIYLPGTLFRSALLARRRLERMIHNKINERREMKWEQTNLLSCLLNYRDENGQILTDGQIADNIIGVLFAAQDTTASVLTWILKYISDDPHLLTTIEREQMPFYVSNDGGTQTLTWAQTRNMPFTNRVIMESLRMASIVSFTYREAVADVEYNGFLIPKGWKVLPLFRIIHHNPDFFREPQNFDPSRFECGQKPNTYVPFGNGAHACPGNELAKLEMLIMIYHLVNGFRWEVVGSKSGVQYSPFLIPKEGLPARFWMKSENLKT